MNEPFITATAAREQIEGNNKRTAVQAFNHLHSTLEHQVRRAIEQGMFQATVEVPTVLVADTLPSVVKGFQRPGYHVKVEREEGLMAAALIREARTFISISW